ncbi:glutamate-1-semialdehyde 2,1-aminomutase [bacterium]|nr:glutamate-1-semialdehyde 2,1-aminomutase [bacterium]
MKQEQSLAWFERASRLIPGGVNSPVRSFKHVGRAPVYFERAQGPYLFDVDGNRYTDFCLAFGPHLLGHTAPAVVAAITEQVQKGMTYGACHPGEVRLAEWILKAYPFFDKVRLLNSGTEAVMTAVRLARGFTGRPKVIQFEGCYHGHSDGLLAKAGSGVAFLGESSSQGVPASIVQETLVCRYDDFSSLQHAFEAHPGQIAAVILEPVAANHGLWVPSREALQNILSLARQNGALVIFDEVICGMRLGFHGASGFFDLQPDLVTLGKVIGGGMPVAAVVGRSEVLSHLAPAGSVYQAGTLSGNPLGVAAGCAVFEQVYESSLYEDLAKSTREFVGELAEILGDRAVVRSVASLFWIHFGNPGEAFPLEVSDSAREQYAAFFRSALDQGVYLPPSPYEVGFLSKAHTPEVLKDALARIKEVRG